MHSRISKAALNGKIRSAIVGTGYIADSHARGIRNLKDVELVAVCDVNLKAAEAFAAAHGGQAYASMDQMLTEHEIDVAHILVPPDLHHSLAKRALQASAHVFVEKPMCTSAPETRDLLATARAAGVTVGVNHSMLFIPAYERLRRHVRNGDLGPLDYLCINHLSELGVIRLGSFGNWIVRDPANTFLEIGPHPVSELIDLVGVPDEISVTADRDLVLPGGGRAYRRWRIHARAGRVAADINLELGPGFPQRTITARGLLGSGSLDYNANTCTIDRLTPTALDFDRRRRSLEQAKQIQSQARRTFADTLLSKAKLRRAGNPDQISIQRSVAAFYAELRDPVSADSRISGDMGQSVIETCERIIRSAKLKSGSPRPKVETRAKLRPNILVLGGTGFIGRQLIKQLLAQGHAVRAAARGSSVLLDEIGSDRLEIARADMRSGEDLGRILDGVEYVFHLATTAAKNWGDYVEQEIEPARALARACLDRGVKRLIYTGTIDSYYAGSRAGRITEATPLDPKIKRRNVYARAKAAVEDLLLDMHRTQGLPVVIVRPGIVIGEGGNPFHWGVGKWSSEGVVETWGDGDNKLPLVLVNDVASGLVKAMEVPGIEGRSFNLIDLPLMSAREYVDALGNMAGFQVEVHSPPIWQFYLADLAKWPVKLAVGHPDGQRVPSYSDWESRSQKATFDCSAARRELGWEPASNRERLVNEGIGGSLAGWLRARE